MYVKYAQDGSIEASSQFQFPGSQQVSFEVVRGYDGKLYEKGKEPVKTPEQVAQEEADARRVEILQELADLDAQGARASRGIALAYAAGETPNVADVSRLTEIENAAKALRTELAAL